MKKIITLYLLLMFFYSTNIFAQDNEINTIFKKGKTHYSAYLASSLCISELINNVHLNSWASIGLIVNRNHFMGLYRSSYQTLFYRNIFDNNYQEPYIKEFTHKGFEYEYIINPLKVISFGGGMKAGTGKLVLNGDPEMSKDFDLTDHFLSLTPSISAGLNLTAWMKLKLNVGYRIIYGIESFVTPWGSSNKIEYFSNDFMRPEFSLGLVIGGLNDKVFRKN